MVRLLLVTTACVLFAFAREAAAADASALFADGERAFASGNYPEALQLFTAARDAGSTGPSTHYNIGVCEYRLGDYEAAEATFAALAAGFPALRELAEYNRGLALRAQGDAADARLAFERAQTSDDDKIVALATAQLGELGGARTARRTRWSGWFSGGLGYDDNVALVDEFVVPTADSSSSPLAEVLGLLGGDFGAVPLRLDATGYSVRYADASEFDQSAIRFAMPVDQQIGSWLLAVGPTLGRSTLDGDGFEETLGADLRLRRNLGATFAFDARVAYDDIDAGDTQFAYLAGSRRRLRLAVQHSASARVRVGYDVEHSDRAGASVSASRQRWSVAYRGQFAREWTADAALYHRTSRYDEALVPRTERLLEASFAVGRELWNEWTLTAEYRWSDNDSNVSTYSYDAQRVAASLSRSFNGD
jgi:tetratricopeptide (TPR) repeat protein